MDAELTKACRKCGMVKPMSSFYKNKGMKDGHLHMCSVCSVAETRRWRDSLPDKRENRRARYHRELELGTRRRDRSLEQIRQDHDPERRKRRSLKYAQKRHAFVKREMDELTELAVEEAISLSKQREKITGFKWSLDHIVPLRYAYACGLHVAANFQVVPARWNYSKGNRHTAEYFGRAE